MLMYVFALLLCMGFVTSLSKDQNFDFIVVGSGSAGAIIANRLSEEPFWNVLLLEAGGYPNPITDVPARDSELIFTDNNWNYTYEPQKTACLAMIDGRCPCPRGRTLGGTSSINGLVYSRGHPLDYDHWEELGNPGWSYKEVLPYFKKSERCHAKGVDFRYHGRNGPMGTNITYIDEVGRTFLKAGVELGYKYNPDYNTEEEIGFSRSQSDTEHGIRQSTYRSFLKPFMNRTNLHIEIEALATKILINKEKKAYGVEYLKDGKKNVVRASKEVIVSGGTINSPQLLILSGIGAKEDLQRLNITLIQDLPVGKVFKEHYTYYGLVITTNATTEYDEEAAWREFKEQGTGPLTAPSGQTALAFMNSNNMLKPHPDIELLHHPSSLVDKSLAHVLHIKNDIFAKYTKSFNNQNHFAIIPTILNPKSTGFLKIESADPLKYPLIFGNFLSEQEDLDVMLKAVRIVQKLIKTRAFQKIDAKFYDSPVPGCEDIHYDSDDYWFCAFRRLTATLYHASSTCKMGPDSDKEAVVDNKLRVYGVKRLRVADCSIIPHLPRAHTNAPCMMIGEKVSDLIKLYWLGRRE